MEQENLEYYKYLNRLRKSGVTNMFGAGEYLENAFDLNPKDARKILASWMEWATLNEGNLDL